jgi:hypothetical protein
MQAPRLELHPRHVQVRGSEVARRVSAVECIHRAIDFLAHLPRPFLVARRWQLLDALLFQAGAPRRLAAAALLTVALVALGQLAMERRVLRAR